MRREMSTESEHLCDVRKGRLIYTSSRRVNDAGSVRQGRNRVIKRRFNVFFFFEATPKRDASTL